MPTVFFPSRRTGLIFQTGAVLSFLAGSVASLLAAFQQSQGVYFVILILISLVLLIPLVVVGYRVYALLQASYSLERDGLHLRWGLRAEDIPLPEIEWIRPADELAFHLPLPFFQLPGSILGSRQVEGLGSVEFLASDVSRLLLIATPQRVYAISPADPSAFMRTFLQVMEMGSLVPIRPYSSRPAVFMQGVWSSPAVRAVILVGLGLTLALFVIVGLRIPTLSHVSLGFDPRGQPLDPAPPERLLLLPVLSAFVFILDLILGLFFYRRLEERLAAFLIWISAIIFPALLILAVFQLK